MNIRSILICILLATATNVAAQAVAHISRVGILFAGDLMQHESQLNAARQSDGTYSYSPCYSKIKGYITEADIAIANLETTIAGKPYGGYPMFCAPDSFLYAAQKAGFDIMLLANNHCLDRGQRGAMRTLAMLDSLGIEHLGVYRDSTDRAARYPYIVKAKGLKIALLNYTYGTNGIPVRPPMVVNLIDKTTMERDIAKARSMHPDAIIACMHWGDEFTHKVSKEQRELTDWLIAQGVNHVIGNHPHVIQPFETRRDTASLARHAIVYSLGNLISGMYARGRDGGALVTLRLRKFFGTTRLEGLEYLLAWVARPERDGVGNFEIWPAATPPMDMNRVTKTKLEEFVEDSRNLLGNDNSLIKEVFAE